MMANSSEVGESGEVSGHRSVFSRTCSLLSQYVKEKKAIADLSLGMLGNVGERGTNDVFHPTTMNLFPVNDSPEEEPRLEKAKSIALFPQLSGFSALPSGKQSSQMTIFYAGQVIVFNDFSANKAKEIMELASQGISQKSTSNIIAVVTHANTNNTNTNNDSTVMKGVVDVTTLAPPNANKFANSFDNTHQLQERAQQPTSPVVTDLPIARKASLHRFLEERKDRIKAKAPYNTSKPVDVPLKPSESNSWLALAAAQSSSLQSRS